MPEFDDFNQDFGFSTISEAEYQAKIQAPKDQQVVDTNLTNKLESIDRKMDNIVNAVDYQIKGDDAHKEHLNGQYIERMKKLEQLIIPLLQNFIKTSDNEYIYWPNRKPKLEQQISRIQELTRDQNVFIN